jgi:hypothetical protein
LREEARKERLEASDAIAILLRCPQKRRDRAKELRTLALFSENLFFFFFFFFFFYECVRARLCVGRLGDWIRLCMGSPFISTAF